MAGKTPSQTAKHKPQLGGDDLAVSTAFHGRGVNAGVAAGSTISVTSLTLKNIESILESASRLEAQKPMKRSLALAHRRVALLFYEASTRTRTSFELAAKTLGAETTLVSALSSSIEKGESLQDTGLNLRALGAEAIVIRHPNSGAAQVLAQSTGLPVLNAGDGMHEHPSQALLDLRTILQWKFGRKQPAISDKTLRGVTVTICGDIFHSRVARSNAMLLPRLGARVLLCGPPVLLPEIAAELLPAAASQKPGVELPKQAGVSDHRNHAPGKKGLQPLKPYSGSIEVRRDFEACMRESDVVMMLRIQKERLQNLQLNLDEYIAAYQLNADRLRRFAPKALLMHPGPMVRGLEITSEVADGPQSAILQQVTNGVAIRMALLARALQAKAGRA
jgi:aspartate carbamoyltransferase catalytic subunit